VGEPIGTHVIAKPHEQVIAYLRAHESAKPAPLPALHPVRTVYNHEAIIPPQCYTRTEGRFNPCYVCHQASQAAGENSMDDWDLQAAYSFSDLGMTNHWQNLFEDRTAELEEISDEEILGWIDEDNYSPLAASLQSAGFDGWVPDLNDLQLAERAFDAEGFAHVSVLAYSAKYASAYYGPFREAADSAPAHGDRQSYQMDCRNGLEAIREVELDEAEGADMVMVKPALAYLDVIAAVRGATTLPLAAYNVSGEYAAVKAASAAGWLDEPRVVRENLMGIRRAGADLIITYHCRDALREKWL